MADSQDRQDASRRLPPGQSRPVRPLGLPEPDRPRPRENRKLQLSLLVIVVVSMLVVLGAVLLVIK